jgi:hypothetical protein
MEVQPYVVEQYPPRRSRGRRLLLIAGLAGAFCLALVVGAVLGARVLPALAAGAGQGNALLLANQSTPGANCAHGLRGALTVASVSGDTITAKRADGTSLTIHVTSSTRFERAGQTVDRSQVKAGTEIAVQGTRNSDGSIAASEIRIVLPHAGGEITQISGSTITVSNGRGTQVIHVSASTTYDKVTRGSNGPTSSAASLSDLKVGTSIVAEGSQNSDGSLAAQAVHILPTPSGNGHGWGGQPDPNQNQ